MFSLIVSTIRRINELERLLESLKKQTYKEFEVIIIDQNENGLVDDIVNDYSVQIEIKHINVSPRGASEARNTGVPYAKYDLISFPDDDCWYDKNILEDVKKFFVRNDDLDVLTCKSTNLEGTLSHTKFKNKQGNITQLNSLLCGIEFTIFLKKTVMEQLGGFDEKIGPGSNFGYGAGEAHDFLLRIVSENFKAYYTPSINIYHEVPLSKNMIQDDKNTQKLYGYAKGFGYVLKKNNLPFWYVFYYLIRPFIGSILGVFKLNLTSLSKIY